MTPVTQLTVNCGYRPAAVGALSDYVNILNYRSKYAYAKRQEYDPLSLPRGF